IEVESPEERGYGNIRCNLTESSVRDATLGDLGVDLSGLVLAYGDHRGDPALRELVAARHGGRDGADVLIAPGAAAALFFIATSRDMTYGEPLPPVASLTTRGISVGSLSKSFGLPGIRTGWAVTHDAGLAETLLAAKEQVVITGSTVDEAIAGQVLSDAERRL